MKFIALLFASLFINSVQSQNIEFLKSIGSDLANEQLIAVSASTDDFVYSLIRISSTINQHDSFTVDSFSFVKNKNTAETTYLIKQSNKGKLLLTRNLGDFGLKGITTDGNGNIFITGQLSGVKRVIDSVYSENNGSVIFCKFDSSLSIKWIKQIGNNRISISHLSFMDHQLFFIAGSDTGKTILGPDTLHLKFGYVRNIIGNMNPENGDIKWANYIYQGPIRSDNLIISDVKKVSSSIFVSGYLQDSYDRIIHGDTFFGGGGCIFQLDTSGNYVNGFSLHNKHYVQINSLSTDGVNLFFGGYFRDTLDWFGKKILPDFPTISIVGNAVCRELFMASISAEMKQRWFLKPKILDSTRYTSFNAISNSVYSNGFIYYGGRFGADIQAQGFSVKSNTQNLLMCKVDTKGNILWMTNGGETPYFMGFDAVGGKSVYATGAYLDTFTFTSHTIVSKGLADGFICKITDYDITRGPVKFGPYCAGDTIQVPYTHIGVFDSSNFFIAELSDEYGNFDGAQRELGRIKSTVDSVVSGILPHFLVASSGEYRIRIRSTAPAIQSYYILDSLRLLIYSRDKADPGPTDTICFRDSTFLETFGGTKWTWSPAWMMDDSTLRTPRIWPDKDTVYRIIISDSSGCGQADTAFKTIVVKPRPTLFGDTVVYKCSGTFLRIRLGVTNSDSGHFIRWYRNNKLYFTGDSLLYTEDAATSLMAVLHDFCSPVKDTFWVKVLYNSPSNLISMVDTTVCMNAVVPLWAQASDGYRHTFQWYDAKGNFLNTGVPMVQIQKSDSFKVVLSDACLTGSDSAWKYVSLNNRINPAMKTILPPDTLLCDDFSITLSPNQLHNDDTVFWYNANNGMFLSSSSAFNKSSPGSIALRIQNICGISTDTILIERDFPPSIHLDSNYSPCDGKPLILKAGDSSMNWHFKWSTADTAMIVSIEKSGKHWASASNRCGADTAFFNVQFIPKPEANFHHPDVCEGSVFKLIQSGKGGKSFLWRLGDGTVSTDSTAIHIYPLTGQARTYLVTLLAAASKDCADSITLPVNVLVAPTANFTHSSNGRTVYFSPVQTLSGASWLWHFGDSDSSTLSAPSHTYQADSGTYTVCLTVTNAENCTQKVCKQVHFSIGITELNRNIKIYPNPTDHTLYIESSSELLNGLTLTDLNGRILYRTNVYSNLGRIDVSGLSKGLYLLTIQTEKGSWQEKIEIGR